MHIDEVTKSILDTIEIKPTDKVEVSVEKDDMGEMHRLKVLVNKTEQDISIMYRYAKDFDEEIPMYSKYFTSFGAQFQAISV